eukprot:scaffold21899_cov63-Phaeocystis_antarctica.AAC.2
MALLWLYYGSTIGTTPCMVAAGVSALDCLRALADAAGEQHPNPNPNPNLNPNPNPNSNPNPNPDPNPNQASSTCGRRATS